MWGFVFRSDTCSVWADSLPTKDVGPDPGVCVKRDGPHVQGPCAASPSSCQNRTRSPGRAPSVLLWCTVGGISALHALGGLVSGLVTPDRPVTDRHRGVTVRYGMVHRLPSLMNTWEGNSIGLADAAGQMV